MLKRKTAGSGLKSAVVGCENGCLKEDGCNRSCMTSVGRIRKDVKDDVTKEASKSTGCNITPPGGKLES